ncbi:membrane protein [Amycolatopsis sp. MJM2582]|nr:membrane protein [Amycolatopsis sp. MJM2582]
MTTNGDVESAARLVSFGMRPKQLPSRDVVYGDLVRRYGEDRAFKQLTHAVAAGLGLMVLEVNLQAGAVLAATDESVFEIKMDSYARQSKIRERRETEKVLHGLVHLATAALGYPRPDDLANDTYIGRVSVEQVDAMVREACRILDERAAQAEANNDPLADAPELEQAWRAYARRPAAAATKDGRLSSDTTRGMVARALRFLADQGFLVQVSGEQGGTYRTTPRYQVQVRELAADAAFDDLLELNVVSVANGGGTLRAAASDTL